MRDPLMPSKLRRAAALTLAVALVAACASTNRTGLRRHPDPKRATVANARAATRSEQWSLAASFWYEIYLAGGDEAPNACVEAARALSRLGDLASARGLLDDGFKRYPQHLELLEAHAEVLVDAGFRRAAEPYLERALQRNPDQLSSLLALAQLRVDLSLEDRALPLLERRVELGGADAQTWRLIARAERKAGRSAQALAAYAKAFAYGENDPDRLVYAASLFVEIEPAKRGDIAPEAIRDWLLRAVELDPQLTAGHELLARWRLEFGDVDGAIASFERALELRPERNDIALRLGRLHRKQQDPASAARLAEHALRTEKDPERRAEFESWLTPPVGDG